MTDVTKKRWRTALAVAAVLFGLATIIEGGEVLFGGEAARTAAGHYVPFVLVFNWLAGFVYVLTGVLVLARRRVAGALAWGLAVATTLVLVAFLAHVGQGGAFERRTLVALPLRTVFWLVQAALLRWTADVKPPSAAATA